MSTQQRPATTPAHTTRARWTGAYPAAAAAFLAGLVYVWGEAAFRLLFTYFPGFNADWVLWNGRVGDIAAMWLTISGAAAVTGVAAWLIWRHRERVGSLAAWVILLIGSAIAAPMIGEIGQTSGSVTNGVGSTQANAVIAYIILGLVLIGCGTAFAVLRRRH
jgi:hypothetical protein